MEIFTWFRLGAVGWGVYLVTQRSALRTDGVFSFERFTAVVAKHWDPRFVRLAKPYLGFQTLPPRFVGLADVSLERKLGNLVCAVDGVVYEGLKLLILGASERV